MGVGVNTPYRVPADREAEPRPPRKPINWESVGMWALGWGLTYLGAFAACDKIHDDTVTSWGIRVCIMVVAFGLPFGAHRFHRAMSL